MDYAKNARKLNKPLDSDKIAIISFILLTVSFFTLYFFISNVRIAKKVNAKVYQSINYKEKSNITHKDEYTSLVYLTFTIKNKIYTIKTDESGTIYKGDNLNIYVNKYNPNELVSRETPYRDLGISIICFVSALGMLFLLDPVMKFIKKLFKKKEGYSEYNTLYKDIFFEKEVKRKWKDFSLSLSSIALIIGFIILLIFGIHKCIYYHYYSEKKTVDKAVTIINIDDSIIGYWKDSDNAERLDYLCKAKGNTWYIEGDTMNLKVEENTVNSKKVSTIPTISDILLIFAALLTVSGLLAKKVIRKIKYNKEKKG